jgi:O-acetyl-ADP-ribose deacetylase (regulator of RNase III)
MEGPFVPHDNRLQLALVDIAAPVADALSVAVTAAGLDDVEVVHGSLFDVDADAVVSPGNSLGFMDGGVDLECVLRFGRPVADRVRMAIRDHHHGELLVGQALIVPTDSPRQPLLISAPTMRVPMRLPPSTANPYLAMRAVLLAVLHGHVLMPDGRRLPASPLIQRVAVPGLGTGVGRVPPSVAAAQMVEAIRQVRDRHARPAVTWDDAVQAHRLLTSRPRPASRNYGGDGVGAGVR